MKDKQQSVLIFKNVDFGILITEYPIMQKDEFEVLTLSDGVVLERKHVSEDNLLVIYKELT